MQMVRGDVPFERSEFFRFPFQVENAEPIAVGHGMKTVSAQVALRLFSRERERDFTASQ